MLDREVVEGDLEVSLDKHGIGLVVWSPLAGGLLTGKYDQGIPEDSRGAEHEWIRERFSDERIDTARALNALAAELGVGMPALALAWALKHPHVDSVITGATKPDHVTSNLKALEIEITPEISQRIDSILANRPANSHRPA
jgi:aryl-alcohol dehydrogenase-like predicted oxidoreductase